MRSYRCLPEKNLLEKNPRGKKSREKVPLWKMPTPVKYLQKNGSWGNFPTEKSPLSKSAKLKTQFFCMICDSSIAYDDSSTVYVPKIPNGQCSLLYFFPDIFIILTDLDKLRALCRSSTLGRPKPLRRAQFAL